MCIGIDLCTRRVHFRRQQVGDTRILNLLLIQSLDNTKKPCPCNRVKSSRISVPSIDRNIGNRLILGADIDQILSGINSLEI